MSEAVALTREPVAFESRAWGAARISAVDLALLSEVTGLPEDRCLARLAEYDPAEMAAAWRDWDPKSAEDVLAFYSETDLYLWELLAWNGSAAYEPYLRTLARLTERWPPQQHPRALDYGSGIGTAALALAATGYRVTIADVRGRTLEFAKARLARRGIAFDVLEVAEGIPRLPPEGWDVLVCFDVLEHVPDAGRLGRALVGALVPGGGIAITAAFDSAAEEWPHHVGATSGRFRGHRWWLHFQGLGTAKVGENLYRKLGRWPTLVRRAQYALWRATGLRVEGLPR
ncbi:MAG TPA: methyltransferase domain-containing protein [Gaiellaceae bacterium]|nr:methyltransferase domain-containing protein [Gaiellaceae bacterium]